MYIASQILIILSDITFIISVFSKNKLAIVFWLIFCDIFLASHYMLLGGFTGTYIVFTDIAFLIITYILKKKQKEKGIMYLGIGFSAISILIGVLTWSSFYSLLPMIGMTNYFVCMGINNLLINKVSLAINNICNTIYMFLLQSYIGGALNIILIICSITASIITYKKSKNSTEANENLDAKDKLNTPTEMK